jgi:hypothetical protein
MEDKEIEEDPFIEIIWYLSDILEYREDLTREQGLKVLALLKKSHDCDHGISWETIDAIAESILDDKE